MSTTGIGLLGRCQGHSTVLETNLSDAIVLNFVLKTFGEITYMNGKLCMVFITVYSLSLDSSFTQTLSN
jgi:hypothetical protein